VYASPAPRADSLLTDFDDSMVREDANRFYQFLIKEDFITQEEVRLTDDRDSLCAAVWYWAAEYYYDIQDYVKASEYGLRALPYCQVVKDKTMEADCASLLGLIFVRMGEFDKAALYTKQCNQLDRESGDPNNIASSYNSLAGIYMSMHRVDEAERYILEAIRYVRKANNPPREAVIYGMASEVYQHKNIPEKTLEYASRALEIEQQLGRSERAAVRMTQCAAAYTSLEQYSESEKYLNEAIPVLEQGQDIHSLGIAYNQMGDLLYITGRNEESAQYYYKALDIFVALRDIYNESHTRKGLREALRGINPEEALKHGDRFEHLRDSIFDRETSTNLSYYASELENDLLQQKNATQRKRFLTVSIVTLIVIIGLIILFFVLYRRQQRIHSEHFKSMMGKIEQLKEQDYLRKLIEEAAEKSAAAQAEREAERDRIAMQAALAADDNVFLSRVVDYVNHALPEGDISVEALAKELCLSESTFRRKMIAITGESPKTFIIAIQLKRSKELLLSDPNMLVSEVAEACGFKEANSFIRAFSRSFGQTPTQWRTGKNND